MYEVLLANMNFIARIRTFKLNEEAPAYIIIKPKSHFVYH